MVDVARIPSNWLSVASSWQHETENGHEAELDLLDERI